MQSFRSTIPQHKCQIDCTNHDEVINGLEMKSKDLYFFWVYNNLFRKTMNGSITGTTQTRTIKTQRIKQSSISREFSNWRKRFPSLQKKTRN